MTLSCFSSLQTPSGLQALDTAFIAYLTEEAPSLAESLLHYRHHALTAPAESTWMIAVAPYLEIFIARLFEVEKETQALFEATLACNLAFIDKKKNSRLYHPVEKKDYTNLVPLMPVPNDPFERLEGLPKNHRERDGFALTDSRMSREEVMDEIDYCVYCHKNEGDFCSKGFPVKKTAPELGFKHNPTGDLLTGCPLEEKISEMHTVKKMGYGVGALAIITIDNPMCAVTGHRICNDCMKACIYQKQDPVNIPEVETRVLTDVLDLPWGVEIYDLLIRWNPLRKTQYAPKNYNGKKILIAGMGPAGFTLAHHLLMEGCAVVGSDGLKIEPLASQWINHPIRDFNTIKESLDDRIMSGFGGVTEYGITVRWDKNFLKLIYLSLMRRSHFQLIGSIRFGGTITVPSAWKLGFDHISIAVGAGLPRELAIPHALAPGMRSANDFLMALQLTGAVKKSSMANLQMRLPAVVIGGGLTGVDAATEAQAYYLVQVEKAHQRYHILKASLGESALRAHFSVHDLSILDEFLMHAEAVIAERQKEKPALNALIRQWGGVTIAYRKSIQESPAYQRNHEELIKALEEGIYYAEGLEPASVVLDATGDCAALTCHVNVQDESGIWRKSSELKTLPAKSIFVATGAKPNIAYEFEHRGTFERVDQHYRCFTEGKAAIDHLGNIKEPWGVFTSYAEHDKRVSFLGDTHPVFHGSVVKAIASAQKGYPAIMKALSEGASSDAPYDIFRNTIARLFETKIEAVIKHTATVVELIVHAPILAKQHQPGQFYRVQNFETASQKIDHTLLQTETVPVLGVYRDENPDCLSFFIFTKGVSTKILAAMKKEDPISVMGPTGAKSRVFEKPEKILIIGNEMALMYLLAVGPALKKAGHQLSFIGTMDVDNAFCVEAAKALVDDCVFYDESKISAQPFLKSITEVFVVGATHLLKYIQHNRAQLFSPETKLTASVYGSMQCMLKGVCAQCLQWQIDPTTGQRTKAVYSCSWQHQPIEIIDLHNLDERQGQNRMQEKLSLLWFEHIT